MGAAVICLAAPTLAAGAECAGDECQVPPPPPEETIPGTAVVSGPENPPVHFPKPHKKHHHKRKHHANRHPSRGGRS